MLTPNEYADKLAKRLSAATEEIKAGVNRVDQSPTEKAASKKDKMKANLLESLDSGKWERGLKRVTLQDWKSKMLEKGVGRISQGIQSAKPKLIEFASQFLPHVEAGRQAVEKMPDLTLEDAKARAVAMIEHNAKFRRS